RVESFIYLPLSCRCRGLVGNPVMCLPFAPVPDFRAGSLIFLVTRFGAIGKRLSQKMRLAPDAILRLHPQGDETRMKIETLAVHGGYSPDPTTRAVAVPIYQTTSYAFDSTQHGADLFDLKV